jgi:hypothetical protein
LQFILGEDIMSHKSRIFLLSLTAIIVVLMNAVSPLPVLADDSAPPETPSAETVEVGDQGTQDAPPEAPVVDETPAPTEEATSEPDEIVTPEPTSEEPVEATSEAAPEDATATPEPDEATSEPSSEEAVSVPEVLEQAPEGTELVVLNENGEAEPLATEDAAEILTTGDPIWCPAGQAPTPGANGCTVSFATFDELLAELTADATSGTPVYVGSGTIYVEATYNGNDDAQIAFDGSTLTNISGTGNTLNIQGGWNGDTGTDFDLSTDITGTSLADVSMVFVNWTGDLVISDFDITNTTDDAGVGLYIDTDGAVELDNVSVSGTVENSYGYGDGAEIHSTGDVDIYNGSQFNNNAGNGLLIDNGGSVSINDTQANENGEDGLEVVSAGNISLSDITVSQNTLTGAYLDTCLFTGDVCLGTGNVNIFSTTTTMTNFFSDNGRNGNSFDGLVIDSGGSTSISNVTANNNALNGVYVTNGVSNSSGTVSVMNSEFSNNENATGLEIHQFSDGDVSINNVTTNGNNMGTIVDATSSAAMVNINNSQFSNNDYSGLHVEAVGDINLTQVIAGSTTTEAGNGTNGAYLISDQNISVSNSTFNENVHFNFPEDPGLYAQADGNIDLDNVTANDNIYGAGVVLVSNANSPINVNYSTFDNNGTFGIQATSGSGNIYLVNSNADDNGVKGAYLTTGGTGNISVYATDTSVIDLDDPTSFISTFNNNGSYGIYAHVVDGDINVIGVQASYNGVKGAYLIASCTCLGNIFVSDSLFVENGTYGVYALTNEGDITLDNVLVTGDDGVAGVDDDLTNIGAFLRTENGGNVFVNNSTFELNTEVGLVIVATGEVNLENVLADQNGENGVEIYSPYTYDCLCPDEGPISIVVNVDDSTFSNNGGYGLQVLPGPEGEFNQSNNTFTNNALGDYLVDTLFVPEDCPACACGECCDDNPPNPKEPKEPKIIQVPFEGIDPVEQQCETTDGTLMKMPDGTWVKVGCPFDGSSSVSGVDVQLLPGELGAGTDFLSGILVSLYDEEGNLVIEEGAPITLTFELPSPEERRGRSFSVLFWDESLNDGQGGWVQLPPFELGTSFPLHPDDPEDGRLILSGVQEVDGMLTVTVNFPGIFIMVAR